MTAPECAETTRDEVEPLGFRALLNIALLGSGISAVLLTAAGFVLGVAYGYPGAGLTRGALLGAGFAVITTLSLMAAAALDARGRRKDS